MTPEALVAEFADRGIEFQLDGDKLRYRPTSLLSTSDLGDFEEA